MKPIRKSVPRPTFERRPPIFNPGNNFVFFNAKSDSRKSWQVNLGGNRWRDAVGGSGSYQSVGLTVQPTDRVQASVSASYSEGTDDAQWIVNEDADGDTVTDYVYGALDRRVVDVTFRGTYAFNRDLTLRPTYSHSSRSATTQASGRLRCPTRPRQHALLRVGSLAGRRFEAGCLQTVERHRHRVRRRAHSHI